MPINQKYNLLFIHIPKNAGTTIENIFSMYSNPSSLWSGSELVLDEGNFAPQHLNYSLLNKYFTDVDFSKMIKFTFVRNPYSRAISLFNWNLKRSYYKPKFDNKFTNREFSNFLKEFVSKQDSSHKLPQSFYFDCEYDFVGRVENFKEDFTNFLAKYNIPIKYKGQHDNKTNSNQILDKLSLENIDLINKLYEEDFKRFNYDMK